MRGSYDYSKGKIYGTMVLGFRNCRENFFFLKLKVVPRHGALLLKPF